MAAGALAAAMGVGAAGPAAAAAENTFSSQWADAEWSGSGAGWSYEVTASPGRDDHNGRVTEYLNTKARVTSCSDGVLRVVTFEKREQARDLKGVELDTRSSGGTMLFRSVKAPATYTESATTDCATASGPVTTRTTEVVLTLKAQWYENGSPVSYSGEDCGGTGSCHYVDAKANAPKSSFNLDGRSHSIGSTTAAWLWAGDWDLDAT